MTIRPMQVTDLDCVLEIADGLLQAPRWAREAYEAAVRPGSAPQRVALAAEDPGAGEVIGFAVASVIAPEAELETIGVAAEWQRRGVGRCLIEEIRRSLVDLGVTKVTLEVRESNGAARRLYRSSGFEVIGRRASYYVDPKEDAVTMSLSLPEANLSQASRDPVRA